MVQKPAIVILGVGRLGSALACLASGCGYPVMAITAGRRETAETISQATGLPAMFDNVEAVTKGDIILITVPDRILPVVLEELIAGKRKGRIAPARRVPQGNDAHNMRILFSFLCVPFAQARSTFRVFAANHYRFLSYQAFLPQKFYEFYTLNKAPAA